MAVRKFSQAYSSLKNVNAMAIDQTVTVDILVCGGGGSGQAGPAGAGGGAGGLIYQSGVYVIKNAAYTATIGAGGSAQGPGATPTPTYGPGYIGNPTSLLGSGITFTAIGGGAGGAGIQLGPGRQTVGGCGGGGQYAASQFYQGGLGVQGQPGGSGAFPLSPPGVYASGAGGGGAGTAGTSQGAYSNGGPGGDGLAYDITGQSLYYCGGGGGTTVGPSTPQNSHSGGTGGAGGGGAGASYYPSPLAPTYRTPTQAGGSNGGGSSNFYKGGDGGVNTGGGGGAGWPYNVQSVPQSTSANTGSGGGGSGVVIIRAPNLARATVTNCNVFQYGGTYTVYKFEQSGTITFT